jgi:tetratricopeptide (TPR) repeat protein
MKCPVCGAVYRPATSSLIPTQTTCRRCKADLFDLIRLHDQAIWYHRQALNLCQQGDYEEAITYNHQALALYQSHPEFHALAGKLWALQGNFSEAIAAWQQTLKLDPQNAIASNCLQLIEQIRLAEKV